MRIDRRKRRKSNDLGVQPKKEEKEKKEIMTLDNLTQFTSHNQQVVKI